MISSEKIHIDIQERERNQRMSLWKDSKRRRKRATIKHPENNEEERDFTRETRAKIIHHTRPDSQEMLKGILKTVMKGGKLVT